jgi:hypothetical protein
MPSEPEAGLDKTRRRGRPNETRTPQRSDTSVPGSDRNASQSSRAVLATEMDRQAEDLTQTYRRLSHEWVDADNARNIWIANLEDVKEWINKLRKVVEDCEDATKTHSTLALRRVIRQLEDELDSSKEITEAAFRSLQAPDREGQFLKQSELHSSSIKQLRKLSDRCKGLARHLRGTHSRP